MRLRTIESLEDRHLLSFVAPVEYAVGSGPSAVATGYFNDDSVLDLAVANSSSNSVSVLLGNADGTFLAAQHFDTGVAPLSLAVGDINKDGKLDVVTANFGTYGVPATWDLSVLLGNGDGTLQAPQSIALPGVFPPGYTGVDPIPQRPLSVAVGDIDADGNLDLAATGTATFVTGPYYGYWCGYYGCYPYYYYRTNTEGYASVLLGNGTGGFDTGEAHDLGAYRNPNAVAIADLNADGDADVITADGWDLSVLLGDGTGALGSPIHSGSGYSLRSISLGDLDGDGKLDTLLGYGWGIAVQKGNGLGGFTALPAVSTGSPVNSAVVGDVNDDGMMDVVTAGSFNEYHCDYWGYWGCYYGGYWTSTRQATVLLGNGVGSFALPLTSNFGTELNYYDSLPDVALEDLDGDDLPELLTVDYYSGEAVVASNDGNWNPPPSITISDATVVEGDAGTVNLEFTVSIVGDHSGVSVQYATANGGAIADSDYTPKSGTLTFAADEYSMKISVPVIGDTTDEYDEQLYVNLSNASGGQISDSQGIGTIQDDDDAPLMTITDVSKREGRRGSTAFDFTVSLSEASGKWVYVNFATAEGTATLSDNDYDDAGWTIYFAPGETSATITVLVIGDRNKEADETFFVNLSDANEANIADAQGVGTILDDDTHGKGKANGPKLRSEEEPVSEEPAPSSPSAKGSAAPASAHGKEVPVPVGRSSTKLVDLALGDFKAGDLDAELLDQLAFAISGW
jgi:hypothetical protein